MMMRRLSLLVLFAATSAHAASGVLGDWKSPTDSVVRIYKCGNDACMKIVTLAPSAPETTDKLNPDTGLRSRALCGLDIGTGFHPSDADHYAGGQLYDPKSGHTYKGTLTAEGDRLKLRGYIGSPIFGRTELWQRVPAVEACR